MRIVLFGEDIFSAAVLQSLIDNGHTVEAVICPVYKNNMEHRSIEKVARKNSISFFHEKNVNDNSVRDNLLKIGPDLIVCVHLRKILSENIYSLPAKRAINVHPSLLPKYRGLSPQHQALIHGDTETGVTVHYIDETADTGDIIIQEKIPLTNDTYIYDLQLKMLSVYKYLVADAIRLTMTTDFRPSPQDISCGSWFGRMKDSDRRIDVEKTKFTIYNLIRAVSKPYRGAYFNDITVWTSFTVDAVSEKLFLKEYTKTGIYKMQDKLLIRLQDGILMSDDFEVKAL